MCEEFNAIVKERKKEEEKETENDKYPWLDDGDERKYMTDSEILEKYINLDNSCLTESEKVQLRDIIYKYKDVCSLRDEIGTCPNIEIDIDVMDKAPFFIRPYQVREEDKKSPRQRNEKIMLFRNIERRFFTILKSSNVG